MSRAPAVYIGIPAFDFEDAAAEIEFDTEEEFDGDEGELALECDFEECLTPGFHLRSECHTVQMILDQEAEAEEATREVAP